MTVLLLLTKKIYWDKSAASFCHQVSAWLPDMFCNLHNKIKNHENANNSTITPAREKIRTDLEFLEF